MECDCELFCVGNFAGTHIFGATFLAQRGNKYLIRMTSIISIKRMLCEWVCVRVDSLCKAIQRFVWQIKLKFLSKELKQIHRETKRTHAHTLNGTIRKRNLLMDTHSDYSCIYAFVRLNITVFSGGNDEMTWKQNEIKWNGNTRVSKLIKPTQYKNQWKCMSTSMFRGALSAEKNVNNNGEM